MCMCVSSSSSSTYVCIIVCECAYYSIQDCFSIAFIPANGDNGINQKMSVVVKT